MRKSGDQPKSFMPRQWKGPLEAWMWHLLFGYIRVGNERQLLSLRSSSRNRSIRTNQKIKQILNYFPRVHPPIKSHQLGLSHLLLLFTAFYKPVHMWLNTGLNAYCWYNISMVIRLNFSHLTKTNRRFGDWSEKKRSRFKSCSCGFSRISWSKLMVDFSKTWS